MGIEPDGRVILYGDEFDWEQAVDKARRLGEVEKYKTTGFPLWGEKHTSDRLHGSPQFVANTRSSFAEIIFAKEFGILDPRCVDNPVVYRRRGDGGIDCEFRGHNIDVKHTNYCEGHVLFPVPWKFKADIACLCWPARDSLGREIAYAFEFGGWVRHEVFFNEKCGAVWKDLGYQPSLVYPNEESAGLLTASSFYDLSERQEPHVQVVCVFRQEELEKLQREEQAEVEEAML